jgi:hypothetical protein
MMFLKLYSLNQFTERHIIGPTCRKTCFLHVFPTCLRALHWDHATRPLKSIVASRCPVGESVSVAGSVDGSVAGTVPVVKTSRGSSLRRSAASCTFRCQNRITIQFQWNQYIIIQLQRSHSALIWVWRHHINNIQFRWIRSLQRVLIDRHTSWWACINWSTYLMESISGPLN